MPELQKYHTDNYPVNLEGLIMPKYGRKYEEHVREIYRVAGTARFIESYILEKCPDIPKNFMLGLKTTGLIRKDICVIRDANLWRLSQTALNWIKDPHPNLLAAEKESLDFIVTHLHEKREQYNLSAREGRYRRASTILPPTIRPFTHVIPLSQGKSWHIMGVTLDRTHYLIRRNSDWKEEYYAECKQVDAKETQYIILRKDARNETDLRRERLAHLEALRGKVKEPFSYNDLPIIPGETQPLPPMFFKMAVRRGVLEPAGTVTRAKPDPHGKYHEKALYRFARDES